MSYDLPRSTLFLSKKDAVKQIGKDMLLVNPRLSAQNLFTNANLKRHCESTKLLLV